MILVKFHFIFCLEVFILNNVIKKICLVILGLLQGTQVTFFRFIADGFKNIFIHNKTPRISSINNYIYLFEGALAS